MQKTGKSRKRGLAKATTVDLVTISILAALDMGTKQIIHPAIGWLIEPLSIPTGAVAGGVYMLWGVVAIGVVRKPGTATLTSLIESIIALVSPFGNFGVLSFVIYLLPGLASDAIYIVYLVAKQEHRFGLVGCMLAAAGANFVGTYLVSTLVLNLSGVPLAFAVTLATLFGAVGGILANSLLVELRKIGIGVPKKQLVTVDSNILKQVG